MCLHFKRVSNPFLYGNWQCYFFICMQVTQKYCVRFVYMFVEKVRKRGVHKNTNVLVQCFEFQMGARVETRLIFTFQTQFLVKIK